MMKNKWLGSALIITGTAVGAGMLALPLSTGLAGFKYASLVLLIIWLLMTYTGLLILEVTLTLPLKQNSFISMAKATSGPIAGAITWVCILLLLYSLTGAYISGDASLLTLITQKLFSVKLPLWLNSTLFTVIFGSIVWYSTAAVDSFNRLFISLKGILLILTCALLMPSIAPHHLMAPAHDSKTLLLMSPIFLTSFGYHTVIPSITNYIGKQPKSLRKAIILGTSIPFILYLLWLIVTLGMVPQQGRYGFTALTQTNNITVFTTNLMHLARNPWIALCINGFTNIAVITSFLGVTLGLFDLIADVTKREDTRTGRLQTAAITFLPPLIFSFLYPHGFLLALSVAAIFVAVLEILLPAWMVYKLRQKNTPLPYKVAGGSLGLWGISLVGVTLIVIDLIKI